MSDADTKKASVFAENVWAEVAAQAARRRLAGRGVNKPHIAKSMDDIRAHMKEDPAYAYAWHANIAMAMYDEFPDSFWVPDRSEQHKIANAAATRFMKNIFAIDTYYGMLDDDA